MHLPIVGTSRSIENSHNQDKNRKHVLLPLICCISLALLVWFVVDGFTYYSTPYPDRPHHQDYRQLRPAGTTGLLFGYAGSAMMILMLLYSIRKRTRLLGKALSLQSMLRFHIYLGIMGPLLIVLHTSFKVQGLVAVSFWSMVAVATSGFFGRYLYLQIPRNIQGSELDLQELERLNLEMAAVLRDRFHLDPAALDKLNGVTVKFATKFSGGAMKAVTMLLVGDLLRFHARKRFNRDIMRAVPLPKHELREFARLAFSRALLQRRVNLLAQVQQIFHYWHVVHKPFAVIMYLIMLVHIGVAVWTGYGWAW